MASGVNWRAMLKSRRLVQPPRGELRGFSSIPATPGFSGTKSEAAPSKRAMGMRKPMHKSILLPVLGLLALPCLTGCERIEARMIMREGNGLYTQEQYSKALEKYQQALKLDPGATFAWRSVGLSALALYRPGDDNPKNIAY